MDSTRTHRLCRGAAVYATGFVVTLAQMEAMSRAACSANFLARHGGDPIFALKWHVDRHKYEILDGDQRDELLFAIDFFPWYGDLKDAPVLSEEQKKVWFEVYGQHAAESYESYKVRTVRYPTDGAAAYFLEERVQEAIAVHNLSHLLVPIVPRGQAAAATSANVRVPVG
ncbi:hypothetical protein DFH07DRAFT_809879 [Mycena maculata]|uniref:Uncharacterized protein n=1 Tax=Mycena maculata TaxID=230809 RepID=A0AAD7JLK6_9AGAR|nr:hypothetical protein DFH07DRAFT_809879 [Mycena maculata]